MRQTLGARHNAAEHATLRLDDMAELRTRYEILYDGAMTTAPAVQPIAQRPANLTDMVVDSIQQAIINRTLGPGVAVSEASMAAQLNVSKTPVREALLRLKHIGLVVPADRGLRVVEPSPTLIRCAYELRAGLERSAALLAGERASDSDVSAISDAAVASLDCAHAGDSQGFRAADVAFHARIVGATRNHILGSATSDAVTLTRALRARDVPEVSDSILCAQEHVSIAEAIQLHDGETAARRAYQHVIHVMSIVLGNFS